MHSLIELQKLFGDRFYVFCHRTEEEYCVDYLFGSVFTGTTRDGGARFLSGDRIHFTSIDPWEDKKLSEITPEEQKRAREEDRKRQNEKITRDLKRSKELKQKFDSVPIGRRYTKSQELFSPKLTLIKGGLDD